MFRLLVVPLSIGILVSLAIYFIAPLLDAEQGIVTYVAELALNLSNSYFATMPSIVASYIANLNLLIVAITAGLLSMLATQLAVVIGGTLFATTKWIISMLQREREEEVVEDLPAIDIESKYLGAAPGKGIYGRGIDSIDRD